MNNPTSPPAKEKINLGPGGVPIFEQPPRDPRFGQPAAAPAGTEAGEGGEVEDEAEEAPETRARPGGDTETSAGVLRDYGALRPSDPDYVYLYDRALRAKVEAELNKKGDANDRLMDLILRGVVEEEVQVHGGLRLRLRTVPATLEAVFSSTPIREGETQERYFKRNLLRKVAWSLVAINGKDPWPRRERDPDALVTSRALSLAREPEKLVELLDDRVSGMMWPPAIVDLVYANIVWMEGRMRDLVTGDGSEEDSLASRLGK